LDGVLVKKFTASKRQNRPVTFSSAGPSVAILTKPMLKSLLAAILLIATPALAQNWSLGAALGPFGFGRFAQRTLFASAGDTVEKSTAYLSASTRPGLALDLEHRMSDRWSVRFETTGTEAPVKIKDESDDGIAIDAGKVDVGTLMLPIVFAVNPNARLTMNLFAGPAYAAYHIRRRGATGVITLFPGTRARWGGAAGASLQWKVSRRFAIEEQVTDIVTSSPFRRSDFPATATGIRIPKTHNVHVTTGIRVSF
jgi:hypothetical protein